MFECMKERERETIEMRRYVCTFERVCVWLNEKESIEMGGYV